MEPYVGQTVGSREIEIKFSVGVHDAQAVRSKFNAYGPGVHVTVHDQYLVGPHSKPVYSESEGSIQMPVSLRIREINRQACVTMKIKPLGGTTRNRCELETMVGDPRVMLAIFKNLGYEPFVIIRKQRELFSVPVADFIPGGQGVCEIAFDVISFGDAREVVHLIEVELKQVSPVTTVADAYNILELFMARFVTVPIKRHDLSCLEMALQSVGRKE